MRDTLGFSEGGRFEVTGKPLPEGAQEIFGHIVGTVKGICLRHDGTIVVENTRGSQFTFMVSSTVYN